MKDSILKIIEFANNYSTAPYGVLESKNVNKNNRKYTNITFGIARYLDLSVAVYSNSFFLVKSSKTPHEPIVYKSIEDLLKFLEKEFNV